MEKIFRLFKSARVSLEGNLATLLAFPAEGLFKLLELYRLFDLGFLFQISFHMYGINPIFPKGHMIISKSSESLQINIICGLLLL